MKIGIVSDSHGDTNALDMMLAHTETQDVEGWLFAGDIALDAEYLAMVTKLPVAKVAGNNDWPYMMLADTILTEAAGHRILLTHGHLYGVQLSTDKLVQAAAKQGADIVVYGHTHVPDIKQGAVTVLNPGSIARPRDTNKGSFMVVCLEPEKRPSVKLLRV